MLGKLLILCASAAMASAGLAHGGTSISSRKQDDYGNYAFNYDIVDPLGAQNGRWESGDGWGNKRGAYTINDIDGRVRRVEYIADAHGFRAFVKTNEPGTAASAPAAAIIASPYVGTAVHGPVAGPTVVKVAAAAPVYAAVHKTPIYAAAAAPVYAPAPIYKSHHLYAAAAVPVAAIRKAPVYASPYAHRSVFAAPAYGGYKSGYGHGYY